jgi:hypothetical protein
MPRVDPNFNDNVFINCPFDDSYKPLLRALLFTVLDCGLTPRIASESADSGEVRVERIRGLIRRSRYSIHDISRIEPLKPGDFPRFNMPFELGLDLGARAFGAGSLQHKTCLILEKEKHRYQQVLSDISGQDIRAHKESPEMLVSEVRNWLKVATGKRVISGSRIWQRFNKFTSWLQIALKAAGFTAAEIASLEVSELIENGRRWIRKNKTRSSV